MDLPDALYHRDHDRFVPTALTTGPWDAAFQHGGPPSGLLGRSLERWGEHAEAFDLLRVTVDLLRPIPRVPVHVQVQPTRLGRQAHWLTATLLDSDERPLAVAHGLRVRRVPQELPPPHTPARTSPAGPEGLSPASFPFFPTEIAFHRAIELRFVSGTWPLGPITAWIRPRVPLVSGEAWSPMARTLTICDALNGVSPALTMDGWSFPNADLAVHLRRPCRGDWLALQARSTPEASGAGLAHAVLYDAHGEVGHALETLVVRGA